MSKLINQITLKKLKLVIWLGDLEQQVQLRTWKVVQLGQSQEDTSNQIMKLLRIPSMSRHPLIYWLTHNQNL